MDEVRSLRAQVEQLCQVSSGLVGESRGLLDQVLLTIRKAHRFLTGVAPAAACPAESPEPCKVRA
jgi:hypothetical protein